MGQLFDAIREAVAGDRWLVSWHADERCEERGISAWQLAVGIGTARLIAVRADSEPRPSVVARQLLMDGTEVEVVWSWLAESQRALLVTVYMPEGHR